MRILHYFLGFPPYRSGGSIKFVMDLAKEQVKNGNEVLALWPGRIRNFKAQPIIVEKKEVDGIKNFELYNPLPVPLDEGINQFDHFTKSCDEHIFLSFFQKEQPDVIHIHTLMGLYKEFIQVANQENIRTVMTSHDYFGLCPKVTLFRFGECCENDEYCSRCTQCNQSSLSLKQIQLMQSPYYRLLKNSYLVKKLRKKHRTQFYDQKGPSSNDYVNSEENALEFRKLRAYYVNMLESINYIHFNSSLAEEIYNKYLVARESKVIPITHSGISDNRNNGHIENDKLQIYCLAPAKPFKGWNVLKESCDELWNERNLQFELHVYSYVANPTDYMVIHENGYNYSDLPQIMKNADVVISVSVCYETFGFTVQEALSYGVPVIVSDHMGAKDIVGKSGIITTSGNVESLKGAIELLSKDIDSYRENARHNNIITLKDFSQRIMNEAYLKEDK